jgi:hypothetical protein
LQFSATIKTSGRETTIMARLKLIAALAFALSLVAPAIQAHSHHDSQEDAAIDKPVAQGKEQSITTIYKRNHDTPNASPTVLTLTTSGVSTSTLTMLPTTNTVEVTLPNG